MTTVYAHAHVSAASNSVTSSSGKVLPLLRRRGWKVGSPPTGPEGRRVVWSTTPSARFRGRVRRMTYLVPPVSAIANIAIAIRGLYPELYPEWYALVCLHERTAMMGRTLNT
jgi:hypothetical protein